jgi:hypothetical protein
MFAYGADGSFMVTEPPSLLPFPLPRHGFLREAQGFFAAAQRNDAVPSITAGARRFVASGFPSALPDRFTFVQLELVVPSAPALGGLGGAVGEVIPSLPGFLTVEGTASTGDPLGPFQIPYTIDDAGLFRIDVGGTPGSEFASGYIGGASFAEIVPVASDSTPGRVFWLLAARARAWTGTETEAALTGDYHFVDFAVRRSGTALVESHGANGTLSFDGLGEFTYEVQTAGGTMYGTGTYEVDAVAMRVTATVGGNTFLLAAGPDLGLLYGVSVTSGDLVEVLVLGR